MKNLKAYYLLAFRFRQISREDLKNYFNPALQFFGFVSFIYILISFLTGLWNSAYHTRINQYFIELYKNEKIHYIYLKMNLFPFSLIASVLYLVIFLTFCFSLQYLMHWVMGERLKNFKKLFIINLISFHPFFWGLLGMNILGGIMTKMNTESLFFYIFSISLCLSFFLIGIILFAYRFVVLSKLHFQQNTGRAILTWSFPILSLGGYIYNLFTGVYA